METRPQEIVWAQVEKEAETGKTFVSPHPDKEGRPVVMMRPRCAAAAHAAVLQASAEQFGRPTMQFGQHHNHRNAHWWQLLCWDVCAACRA
jgi:hypothetical protein